MMCLVTVRQLKPGSFYDFRTAWTPDPWPAQLTHVEILRNDDDPDQVMTVGYMDVSVDEMEAIRDEPEILAGELARLERIAPFEERVLVNGVFALVEDVKPGA